MFKLKGYIINGFQCIYHSLNMTSYLKTYYFKDTLPFSSSPARITKHPSYV